MKKLLALVCALVRSLSMTAVLAEETDVFTSASVASYYADSALTGDDLMNAINSFSGTYLVCTTNPDGTANAGCSSSACVKNEDKYYIQMGLAENQTKQNLLRTGEALAVYAAEPPRRRTTTTPHSDRSGARDVVAYRRRRVRNGKRNGTYDVGTVDRNRNRTERDER